MSIKTAIVVLAALTSAASVGCSSGGHGGDTTANTATTRTSLHRAKDCGGLLGDLKADAKWKLDRSIDYQINGIRACQSHYPDAQCASYGGYYGGGHGYGVAVSDSAEAGSAKSGGVAPTTANAGAASPASSGASGAGASTGATASAGAQDYSQTNTQVVGVDEADIVKNDGENLYVLHGRAFKVIHAFPATDMKEVGSIDIDGTPTEMFVANGTVVVYSQVNGASVFTAANVKSRTQYQDFGYAYASGGSASGGSNIDVAPTKGVGAPEPGGVVVSDPGPYIPLTKVTVLTLANGTAPVVSRESWFEGSYLDSRRVGSSVRSVFQGNAYGPTLQYSVYDMIATPVATPPVATNGGATTTPPTPTPVQTQPTTGTQMVAALEKLRQTNYAIIDASVIADWLPYTFVKTGGATLAQQTACSDFYVPTAGSTESGVTEVSTLDLSDPTGAPRDTAILGAADTVYASADTLYVAARAWVDPPFAWYDTFASTGVTNGGTAVGAPPSAGGSGSGSTTGSTGTVTPGTKSLKPLTAPLPQPAQPAPAIISWSQGSTHLHKFEFTSDPHFANYLASGTVKGNVKDQFSLDELNGNLRIATSESRGYYTSGGDYSPADSTIVAKGAPAPAQPYQVSHLFVLDQDGPWLDVAGDAGDLAPNETIESVRFVETRGYITTYRQVDPLMVFDLSTPQKPTEVGELTIAGFSEYMQPIDPNHLLTIGRDATNQLQLQIFDVTNPAAPARTWQIAYNGGDYASSDAEYDHKAFTYFADKQLLAIPFYSYGYSAKDGSSMHSSLEVFKIDINAGISHLGSVDGTSLVSPYPNGYCGGYFGPDVRRGVFLDTTVYAVTYGGIAAKDIANLAAPAITYPMPVPVANDTYGVAIPACYAGPSPVCADCGGGVTPGPAPKPAGG